MNRKQIVTFLVLFIWFMCIGLFEVFLTPELFTTQTADSYRNITDLETSYNADAEIAEALSKYKTGHEKATIIARRSSSSQRQIALTFDGLTDHTTIQKILDLTKKYNVKATFFADGMLTAEDPQTVVNIKKAGQRVENYTLSGIAKMETLPVERLIKDFCRAQKIIKVTTDQGPNLLKCNDTKYTEQLLQVAKACGFNSVVLSDAFLDVKQVKSLQAADAFVSRLGPGSIVSVKLKGNIEPIINEKGKTDERPAIDKQPGLKRLPQYEDVGNKDIVVAVESLLVALQKENYTTIYVEDLSNNSGIPLPVKTSFLLNRKNAENQFNPSSLFVEAVSFVKEQFAFLFSIRTAYAAELVSAAEEIRTISTVEPALSYTFGGLSNQTVVNDVLAKLDHLGIKATFFVAEIEMKRYPQTINAIINKGHEIGIAIRPKDGETFEETLKTILRSRNTMQEKFGIKTDLVKQVSGAVSDTTKTAVAASECKLIGQSISVIQTKHKDYTSADKVMGEIFGNYMLSLARGQIIYFRMDFYTNSQLVGELVEKIKQRKIDNIAYVTSFDNPAKNSANDSSYKIKPVGEVLSNTKFVYKLPIDKNKVPVHLRYNSNELAIDKHNLLSEFSWRYIGTSTVTYEDRMLGFSKIDSRRLDKSGLIHTENNVIFLTFDDWGTDAALNKILYVLRKHNAKATFFVITRNVMNNPNLLRSIAMEGHDIGSHSDLHQPMAINDPKTGKPFHTQNEEEYSKDLATSYQKLCAITGDVVINGKSALTRLFRPPTLAISKMGMEALLKAGYEYIVSGSYSTKDYKAESIPQLVRTMKNGLYTEQGRLIKGSILVMHMSDSSLYTATALDILLTANQAKADSDPSKFTVGRLSDYLRDGYSQSDRKKSLKINNHEKVK